jgi:hypothetical protein
LTAIEELLQRKRSGFGLERREYGRRDPSRIPLGILYPQKLALTSPTSCCRSVGIVRLRTQATEFSLVIIIIIIEFGIPMKLVRLIKMCKVRIGKHLSVFRIQNGLNKEMLYHHCFSTLL